MNCKAQEMRFHGDFGREDHTLSRLQDLDTMPVRSSQSVTGEESRSGKNRYFWHFPL